MKKKFFITLILFILVFISGLIYGIYSCEYELFPYYLIMGKTDIPIPPKYILKQIYLSFIKKNGKSLEQDQSMLAEKINAL